MVHGFDTPMVEFASEHQFVEHYLTALMPAVALDCSYVRDPPPWLGASDIVSEPAPAFDQVVDQLLCVADLPSSWSKLVSHDSEGRVYIHATIVIVQPCMAADPSRRFALVRIPN